MHAVVAQLILLTYVVFVQAVLVGGEGSSDGQTGGGPRPPAGSGGAAHTSQEDQQEGRHTPSVESWGVCDSCP